MKGENSNYCNFCGCVTYNDTELLETNVILVNGTMTALFLYRYNWLHSILIFIEWSQLYL